MVSYHGLTLHQSEFADDCQIYLTTLAAVGRFSRCLTDVGEWMGSSRLRLNPAKTQVIWMGSKQRLQKIDFGEIPSTVRKGRRSWSRH